MFNLEILFNLSIIIPALTGIYVFKSVGKEYRYFIISIIAGTIEEYHSEFIAIDFYIFDALYAVLSTQLTLLIYFSWDTKKYDRNKKYIIQAVILILVLIDQYYDYLSMYHIKWGYIGTNICIALYGIRLLTQGQNNLIGYKANLSRKLIIIPFLVFSVYYAAINILMYFLFSKETQPLFMNLYNVIRWINFLSYISYTLALLWAPKKEQFL